MTSREANLVELVDDAGLTTGRCRVDEAHQPPGRLHRAFSVLLLDPSGRMLLQQRAAVKTRFPLRWANSCCGHPPPGQSLTSAAAQRLQEELGVGPVALTEIGVYVYYAEDPTTGRVELEYDHVLRGELSADEPLLPDPAEVAAVRWVGRDELECDLTANPHAYAPWPAGVTSRLILPGPAGAPGPSGVFGGSRASGVLGVAKESPVSGVPGTSEASAAADDAAERSGGR